MYLLDYVLYFPSAFATEGAACTAASGRPREVFGSVSEMGELPPPASHNPPCATPPHTQPLAQMHVLQQRVATVASPVAIIIIRSGSKSPTSVDHLIYGTVSAHFHLPAFGAKTKSVY